MGNNTSTHGDVKPVDTNTKNENNITKDNNVVNAEKENAIQPAVTTTDQTVPPQTFWQKLGLKKGGSHKVVVVKLWANWCGHCKMFEPEWKKLVHHFSKNPNVIFEHLEEKGMEKGGMAMLKHKYGNRISDPKGFPTLYLFRSSDTKKQEPYEGSRTFEGMKQKIEKLLMHKGSHNQTVKVGGAKKGKRKTMHRKRH